MRSLSNTSAGSFLVFTLSGSVFTLDLDARNFVRDAAKPDHGLRRDGDDVNQIAMMSLKRGDSITLVTDSDVPGVDYTTRTTTPVVRVQQ